MRFSCSCACMFDCNCAGFSSCSARGGRLTRGEATECGVMRWEVKRGLREAPGETIEEDCATGDCGVRGSGRILKSRMLSGDAGAVWCDCAVHSMCTSVNSCSFFSCMREEER